MTKYLVTGASGQLGRKVVAELAKSVPAADIAVMVRSEAALNEFKEQGFDARYGDYDKPETMFEAFEGVDRLLLISGSEVGKRSEQHLHVINAAKQAGVKFIAYTSILQADKSPMGLAVEHLATEKNLEESGIPYALLRNGWYLENIVMTVDQDVSMGKHFGAAGEGKFAAASRQDFAEAAVAVLTGTGHEGHVYELAGDEGFTLADYAAAVTEAKGTEVTYIDMPEEDFRGALLGAGLPEGLAAMLADSDAKAADGWLFDDSKTLSSLIGRPTTKLAEML
ncbi:SDR family oxidoreductase [Marivivens donghaensis]|uniref:SDR family oxidoreductase n=1 Tax=Marivivens donghaensis TaxID=1699413 RepID=A0ABX0VTJ3_9RHOB|nr:SDR family oxidoreductase [Marivivens donghaensis]NIY71100.1 SDR family oxidoreductase [Marivivens donghaensis]